MFMSNLSGTSFMATEISGLYLHRPPYAADVYKYLADKSLSTTRLLDLGCGEGKIARPLAKVFDQVVAVDPSANMIDVGRSLENGQAANINWVEAKAEGAPLEGRFDMVTFASSIHWMDPEALFAKLRKHLAPAHLLAIISGDEASEPPWNDDWQAFLSKWVQKATGRPLGSREWTSTRDRHLDHMDVVERHEFLSDPFEQTVESFILCQHSRNSFALSTLGRRVSEFQQDLRGVLEPHKNADGMASYRVKTYLTLAKLD